MRDFSMLRRFLHAKAKEKNTLVSGSAGDEKSLYPGGSHSTFRSRLFLFKEKETSIRQICLWKTALTANSTDRTSSIINLN